MYERPVRKSKSIIIIILVIGRARQNLLKMKRKPRQDKCVRALLRCIAWYSLSNIWIQSAYKQSHTFLRQGRL